MRRTGLFLLLVLLPAVGRADDVRLQNGKVFEGVIAVEHGDQVELRIPGGSLSLPRSSVREIVRAKSGYPEYLERAAALRARGARAAEWLQLARWARDHELDTSAREAALVAAELSPELEGLAPFMRAMGYELDEGSGSWLPLAEAMRRKGMVLVAGQWMTQAEAGQLASRLEAEARERRRERDLDRLEQATAQARLAAAEMELARANVSTYSGGYGPYDYGYGYADYWPVGYYPGYWPVGPWVPGGGCNWCGGGNRPGKPGFGHGFGPGFRPDRPNPSPPQSHHGTVTLDVTMRQPGSLFPGEPVGGRFSSSNPP